jgi:galactonate dehydratase
LLVSVSKCCQNQGHDGCSDSKKLRLDQALWDIKGKRYGVPVHELMGGKVRDKIKVYQWIGGDRPNDVVAQAKAVQSMGFKAIKMNATDECQYIDNFGKVERVIERVAAIREACGSELGIGIDFHGRVHKPMAKVKRKWDVSRWKYPLIVAV